MEAIKVILRPEQAEAFEELIPLYELEGVELSNPNDPMYTAADWSEEERPPAPGGECSALLYGEQQRLLGAVQDLKDMIVSWESAEIEDRDWMKVWAEGFEGISAGERLFIHPPWIDPEKNKLNICVMPGMAFGTGSHETTRLCSAALEKWMQAGDRVIDVGSGSGVLSLAASALGASEVLAVENDPQTFTNAQENLALNRFSGSIALRRGDLLQGVQQTADLIVANILPPVLIDMAPQTRKVLKQGGILILSGILSHRAGEVLAAYREHYELLEETALNEWCALVLRRVS